MYWDGFSAEDLRDLLDRLDAQLAANEITNPGEFIQIYGAMHRMARFGGVSKSQEDLFNAFLGHIKN